MRLIPKQREINITVVGSGGLPTPWVAISLEALTAATDMLATWVPAKEKNKNKKVPTNSPTVATMLLRTVDGRANMGKGPDPMCPFREEEALAAVVAVLLVLRVVMAFPGWSGFIVVFLFLEEDPLDPSAWAAAEEGKRWSVGAIFVLE